jgi:hypothetical protein
MTFKPLYKIGEFVFLKSDPDQLERQVLSYVVYNTGFQYILCCGAEQSTHFEFEITTHRNVLLSLN